jgi:hypothetical protein
VADRHVAHQRPQRVLVEYLRYEPLVANRHDTAALGSGRDSCRLLAAVLEREQRKVRESSDVMPGRINPENAALVAWTIAMIVRKRHGGSPISRLAAGLDQFRETGLTRGFELGNCEPQPADDLEFRPAGPADDLEVGQLFLAAGDDEALAWSLAEQLNVPR